jgi:hypothetical protein
MIRSVSILLFLVFSAALSGQKQDTIKPRILKQWNLSHDYSEEVKVPFDTVFSLFHRFRLADRYSPLNVTLGNYGLAFYQLNFFDRITDPDRFLYSSYSPVMHLPENALFMNTQIPFTEFTWSYAIPRETSEQTFRFRHSQNVNRFLNFGLIYDIIYDLGQYNYQRAEDKTFTFFSSYTGDKYKLYFSGGINNIKNFENGGIVDKQFLNEQNTRDVPVRLGGLNSAYSMLKNRNILLVQRYTFGGKPVQGKDSTVTKKQGLFGLSGTFSHILILDANRRAYSDDDPASGFYDTSYVSKEVTFDSLYMRSFRNTIRFDFTTDEARKFNLGGGVGIRNELLKYSQIVPTHDTLLADTATWKKNNNILIGRLYNNIGDKFRWLATGELYFTGYRAGDFNVKGEISKSFDFKKGRASWLITGGIANTQPSFWYEQWGGNNIEWHNNMNKEFRIDVGTSFLYPGRNAELRFNYAIIDNYTDFGKMALPEQSQGGLSVAAITLRKNMRAWKLHLDTDVLIQQSSNADVLDLPLASFRAAGYFEHLFKFSSTGGRLYLQLGVDVTYNTLYHPYNYMPATGRFFRQDDVELGNYPFINPFLNFKLRRTRVFLMFDHVNSGYMGYDYDMVPLYPMNVRMFRYGLAWTFYD